MLQHLTAKAPQLAVCGPAAFSEELKEADLRGPRVGLTGHD